MPQPSWIQRVKKLATEWTAWSTSAGDDVARQTLQTPELAPLRLEPRRVLSATIQSLAVPTISTEGETVDVSAEATGGASLQFDWTVTRDSTVIATGSTQDFSFVPTDDGVYRVDLRVTDPADGSFDKGAALMLVGNEAPVVENLTATSIRENQSTLLTGTVVDPGSEDTFTLEIDWGDPLSPGNSQTIDLANPGPGVTFDVNTGDFSVEHQYLDDNPSGVSGASYLVSVTAQDDDGGESTATTDVHVANVAPAITNLVATSTSENLSTTLSGKVTDVGTLDTLTLEIDWGDPLSPDNLQTVDLTNPGSGFAFDASTGVFSVEHQYLDDNPSGTSGASYTISITARDDDGGQASETTTVSVANANPTVGQLTTTSITENQSTILTGRVSDVGTLDTLSLHIDWGDPLSPGNTQTIDLASPDAGVTFDASTGEFSVEHQYLDDNPSGTSGASYAVSVTVRDDDGGQASDQTTVTVANDPPTLSNLTVDDIDENGITTLRGEIADAGSQDSFTLTVNWGDGDVEEITLAVGATEFSASHRYRDDQPGAIPDEYLVRLTLVDDDQDMAVDAVNVGVSNVAPQLTELAATNVNENGITTLSGVIDDPGTLDTFTLDINWGDPLSPGNTQTIDLSNPGAGVTFDSTTREFTVEHRYLDDNPTNTPSDEYAIGVTVADDDGGTSATEVELTVSNVRPTIESLAVHDLPENGITVLSGTIVDAGSLDTFKLQINWGDPLSPGNTQTIDLSNPGAGVTFDSTTREFAVEHRYLDDNPTNTPSDEYTIAVTVTDDDGGSSITETDLTVTNQTPVVAPVADATIDEGEQIVLGLPLFPTSGAPTGAMRAVTFTDPGTLDTHTATIDWGDGSAVEMANLLQGSGGGAVEGFHAYADDGLYTVTIKVTDDDGAVGVREFMVHVVNVDPILTGAEGLTANEGEAVTLAGLGVGLSDPGYDNPFNKPELGNGGETEETFVGVSIDWGDGSSATPIDAIVNRINGGPGQATTAVFDHAEHHYADDGEYTVRVTLRDDDGANVTREFKIVVGNIDPELTGTDALRVNEGAAVTLADLGVGITDPGFDNPANPNGASSETFLVQSIDWGDGSTPTTSVGVANRVSGGPGVPTTAGFAHAAHHYADNGVYTVTVALSDDDGGTVNRAFEIVVDNVAPTLNLQVEGQDPTSAGFQITITEGEVITMNGDFFDPGFNNPLNPNGASLEAFTYDVDWGDGTQPLLQLPVTTVDGSPTIPTTGQLATSGPAMMHRYVDNDADNQYTVTVTLRDDDGGEAVIAFEVTVLNINPTLEPVTATDLTGSAITTLTLNFDDVGLEPFSKANPSEAAWTVFVDWENDGQFVEERATEGPTPASFVIQHRYTEPPNPANPAEDITISVKIRDDDFGTGAVSVPGGLPLAAPLATPLVAAAVAGPAALSPAAAGPAALVANAVAVVSGESNIQTVTIDNPGIEGTNVAIDTTPDVVPIEFPARDPAGTAPTVQSSAPGLQQTIEGAAGSGDISATAERYFELRLMLPDGSIAAVARLSSEAMDDLPKLLQSLPDYRYQIWLIRTENNSQRLVLDVTLHNGRPVDPTDDTEGGSDGPRNTEATGGDENNQDRLPANDADAGSDATGQPAAAPSAQTPNSLSGVLASASLLATRLSRKHPRVNLNEERTWADELEEALGNATESDLRRLRWRKLPR